jgi:hypothetical protein
MTEELERSVIELIATDRLHMPISSMSGKLKRRQPKIAKALDLNEYEKNFEGERVYARIEEEDIMKSRTMKEGVEAFSDKYPRYGTILRGLIEEERAAKETHLYYGVNDGRRLTADDYIGVMTNLGFTEVTAQKLYPELMSISRGMKRKRQETERRILIG